MLADFQQQAGRPYEHEARLKELLVRQTELNAALDLDKSERQIAAPAGDDENATTTTDAAADKPAVTVEARAERLDRQRQAGPQRSSERDLSGDDNRVPARRVRPVAGPKI
jgi:hypothetical protein